MDLNNLKEEKEILQKKIESYERKYKNAKFNQPEHKAMLIVVFGIISFIVICLSNLLLNGLGMPMLGTIFPSWAISAVTVLSSLGIGKIAEKILEKKYKILKVDKCTLEEEIRYEIELEKAESQSKIYDKTIDLLTSLDDSKNYLQATNNIEILSYELKNERTRLDKLITKKVLNERFRFRRNKKNNFLNTLAFTLLCGILTTYFIHIPLPITGAQVNYNSILAIFLASSLGGLAYKLNKNKEMTEIFNKINQELGTESLPSLIENDYIESENIKRRINENIKNISKTKSRLIKQKELLELEKTKSNTQENPISKKQTLPNTQALNNDEPELIEEPAIRTLHPRY